MRWILATLGTAGDLHPMLAIARALAEQGEDVHLLAQEPHRAEVEAQGVVFHAIASAHEHTRTMTHPALWHPVRGFGVLWRHLTVPSIEPTIKVLEQLGATKGAATVLASPLAVGARLAADRWPFPMLTAHTAPASLRSNQHPMFVAGHVVPRWWPPFVRALMWRALDHYKLQPMAAPMLNAWRRRQGLGPIDGPVFGRWIHSPLRTLALFPQDFGPMPTDWPVQPTFCGFPLYEGRHDTPMDDPELNDFLARSHERELTVIYAGSQPTTQANAMRREALRRVESGQACLLLCATPAEAPSKSPWLLQRTSVNLPKVLPQAAQLLHHGGIGITAQAFAAGVPQIAWPSAYDQFDNAWRIKQQNTIAPQSRHAQYSRPDSPNEAVRLAIQTWRSVVQKSDC